MKQLDWSEKSARPQDLVCGMKVSATRTPDIPVAAGVSFPVAGW